MVKKADRDLIVGIDIGTSKVITLIGEVDDAQQVKVIGLGSHASHGLKRGVVVDVEATVRSIQRSVEEAENMASCRVNSAFTGIAGSHIQSMNSYGIVGIRDKEVTRHDIDRVIDAASAVAIPANQKVIHVLPQEYIIDDQNGIREPIGMSGVRMEAKVHLVSGAISAAQNIVKCLKRCGISAGDIVLEQLAASHAVLTDSEKALGTCLIDIGGGTTDIAIFTQGSIRHTAVIPIAGDQVTNDIAVALRIPSQLAEEIKLEHACALVDYADACHKIHVPSFGDRSAREISQTALANVVEARYEELFMLVRAELRRAGFEDILASGIVLSGGGSKVDRVRELAERVFDMPVRLGGPRNVTGHPSLVNNPAYATPIGLLLHASQNQHQRKSATRTVRQPLSQLAASDGMMSKMKSWFQSQF